MGWTWEGASPKERGDWVRKSFRDVKYDRAKLGELFNLTKDGVEKILNGADWQESFRDYDPLGDAMDEISDSRMR